MTWLVVLLCVATGFVMNIVVARIRLYIFMMRLRDAFRERAEHLLDMSPPLIQRHPLVVEAEISRHQMLAVAKEMFSLLSDMEHPFNEAEFLRLAHVYREHWREADRLEKAASGQTSE